MIGIVLLRGRWFAMGYGRCVELWWIDPLAWCTGNDAGKERVLF